MGRFAALVCLSAACGAGGAAADLRVGATYTLEDSGILPILLGAFTKASGVAVKPIVAGTGQVMKYAENGDVDVVFTHSRPEEEKLIARGVGRARADGMGNASGTACPPEQPGQARAQRPPPQPLQRIMS